MLLSLHWLSPLVARKKKHLPRLRPRPRLLKLLLPLPRLLLLLPRPLMLLPRPLLLPRLLPLLPLPRKRSNSEFSEIKKPGLGRVFYLY